MNIPELKKAMERVKLVESGCYPNHKDTAEAIKLVLSACQLLCEVSDKMLPKEEHSKDCLYIIEPRYFGNPAKEKYCNCGAYYTNLARSEDILWLTKKMMGIKDIIKEELSKLKSKIEKGEFEDKLFKEFRDNDIENIANAIRQEMGI